MIRQGRNVVQVRVELLVEDKVALTSLWLFGTAREANAVHPADPVTPAPIPVEDAEVLMADKGPPFIVNNFELRRAAPSGGTGGPVVRRWLRLKHDDIDPTSRLILIGDTMP